MMQIKKVRSKMKKIFFKKYFIFANPGLSDVTKAYLSSNSSGARPELSNFSKA